MEKVPPTSTTNTIHVSYIVSLIEGELAFDACLKNTLENILFYPDMA